MGGRSGGRSIRLWRISALRLSSAGLPGRLERGPVGPHAAVDLGAVAEAAPYHVRPEADDRVAAARGAALDALQEEAVGLSLGKLEHRRDRGLEIGDERGPDHLRPAGLVGCLEGCAIGLGLHAHCAIDWISWSSAGLIDLDRVALAERILVAGEDLALQLVAERGRQRRARRPWDRRV